MDREAILKILDKRTSLARERLHEVTLHFKEILADYPNGTPDGTILIQHTAKSYQRAIEELWAAHSQMVAFLVDNVIPEHLEEDG